jgi:chromosome segregation ATPase
VPITFEALLILIFAAVVTAGLALSLRRARASLRNVTAALAKSDQDRATADRERGLAGQEVRHVRRLLTQATAQGETWRVELRKAKVALNEAKSALAQAEAEREELLFRLEPAQQIIREAVAIRATIESEKVAHARELFERRVMADDEIMRLQIEADALRNAHAVALHRYQSLRRAIDTLQARLAESRTAADSPEVRPVTPPSTGSQTLRAPEIRPPGPRTPLS